jgi:hypothetical protein
MKKLGIAAALMMLSTGGVAIAEGHNAESKNLSAVTETYQRGAADSMRAQGDRRAGDANQRARTSPTASRSGRTGETNRYGH